MKEFSKKESNSKDFKAETQTACSVEILMAVSTEISQYGAYIGLDVHKDTIAIAVAQPGRGEPRYEGEIANTPKAMRKLMTRLNKEYGGELLLFCYEAGPCGYVVFRQITEFGHDCQVIAPSLIPRKPSDHIKTDRRDAVKLARSLRSGDLTAVWVPDEEQEAMRDLTRTRGDFKAHELKARQQLNAYVLRHGHHWPSGKTRWTKIHYNWLESLKFDHDWQHVVLQEYIDAIKAASARVKGMMSQIERVLPQWSMAPVMDSLIALRGIDKLAAIILLAELGDVSRFDSPTQLMSFLGLVPREHSSGGRRHQGPITRAGNGHARRILVESAWSYRFPARQTMHLKRKAKKASDEAKAIAWRAQKRLCGRYSTLTGAGKNTKLVCVAIARELLGFIWDIVRHEMPKVSTQKAV